MQRRDKLFCSQQWSSRSSCCPDADALLNRQPPWQQRLHVGTSARHALTRELHVHARRCFPRRGNHEVAECQPHVQRRILSPRRIMFKLLKTSRNLQKRFAVAPRLPGSLLRALEREKNVMGAISPPLAGHLTPGCWRNLDRPRSTGI